MIELLTVSEVARLTALSEHTIRQAVRDCDLKASKLRGRIRVHPDDLAAWVDDGRVRPDGSVQTGPVLPQNPRRTRSAPASYRDAAKARRSAA